jgi:2-amino-4-hydroxy-6-hydroxymethyldihydropteridine diphosphokinase
MNRAYLLTGGNLGDRMQYLTRAAAAIQENCGAIVRQSAIYETQAWGIKEQAAFLNQVIEIKTEMAANELLNNVLKIEESLGRVRTRKYGPRLIDIDILFFNEEVINTPMLTVPHPQLQNRRFVLEPLNEIAPDFMHPVLLKTIRQLLAGCTDPLTVNKIS